MNMQIYIFSKMELYVLKSAILITVSFVRENYIKISCIIIKNINNLNNI